MTRGNNRLEILTSVLIVSVLASSIFAGLYNPSCRESPPEPAGPETQRPIPQPREEEDIPARKLAGLFGATTMSTTERSRREPIGPDAPTDEPLLKATSLKYVARAADSDGETLYVFMDTATGRVLPLSEHRDRRGWLLLGVTDTAFTLINEDRRYEVPR